MFDDSPEKSRAGFREISRRAVAETMPVLNSTPEFLPLTVAGPHTTRRTGTPAFSSGHFDARPTKVLAGRGFARLFIKSIFAVAGVIVLIKGTQFAGTAIGYIIGGPLLALAAWVGVTLILLTAITIFVARL